MEYYKYNIKGIVQGVGFRPYIYRKAKYHKLKGLVKNTGNGVLVIVNDKDFMKKLNSLPPLAKITQYSLEKICPENKFTGFIIDKSSTSSEETILPADNFVCDDCIKEIDDKNNRRHNYYFTTCTNCGPRFSMIDDYPYDRPFTSMKKFQMCKKCESEYTNPFDRRFHAQTIACKECGPILRLVINGKELQFGSDIEKIKKASEIIKSGKPISVKGNGGFHIASGTDLNSIAKVRELIKRKHKPFAVMVKNIEMAKKFAFVSNEEAKRLLSAERPIVVLIKRDKNSFSSISELDSIGVILPYTALHYLLLRYFDEPIVMTSCNISGDPISQKEILCSAFLTHDRDIINRCDDSVIKIISKTLFFLRRSRGYTPLPVKMPINCTDTIALGAELNNVICAAKKENCFLSQYIGQTSKFDTFEYMKTTVENFIKLTRLKPKIIACDLHPGYNSTSLAKELSKKYKAKLIQIQHHKAHIASVAAEHNITDYVGIAMDGLGYGEDGNILGGEVFDVTDSINFQRIGSLEEQPQLGGDSAAIFPKKMLFGILSQIIKDEKLIKMNLFDEKTAKLFLSQIKSGFNIQKTTSAGRIFDAVAALLDICNERTYDGRPAMILESVATVPEKLKPVIIKGQREIVSTSHLFKWLLENRNKDKGILAATAQMYIAEGLYEIAKKKKKPIVFSGGVAYNRMISGFMISKGVYVNKEIPPGDGGICYGQAYLANLINFRQN